MDLTFTVKVVRSDNIYQPSEGLAHSKVSLDFNWTNTNGNYSEACTLVQLPAKDIIVGGDIPWEGSYNYKDGLTLHSQIKLPKEGIWNIQGNFSGEGWLVGAGDRIDVAVADGTAAIMGTEEFKTGPLAYLGNLNYEGGVWPPFAPNEIHPVSLGMDLSKAPRAGETVILSCILTSLIDISDVSLEWYFLRQSGDTTQDISATELLSSEDLAWKVDIKKGESAIFSTAIKFPMEGNWQITVEGKPHTENLKYAVHNMRIGITSSKSFFGWVWKLKPVESTDTPNTPPGTTKAIY